MFAKTYPAIRPMSSAIVNSRPSMSLVQVRGAACVTSCRKGSNKAFVAAYIQRQTRDKYCQKAREELYRARSAYKLLQLDKKFRILKPGQVVLDVGAAPGSWCQVAVERAAAQESYHKPYILGVDLQEIKPILGVDLLSQADITDPATQKEINRRLGGRLVDVVLSDMAPNPSGIYETDQLRILSLGRCLLGLLRVKGGDAQPGTTHSDDTAIWLAPTACFLCKIWDGTERAAFIADMERRFETVKTSKPDASRGTSAETYVFAKNPKQQPHAPE